MKYIVFDTVNIVTFPPHISHNKMRDRFPDMRPTSAGFIGWDRGKLVCYGRSESLDIGSIPFDSSLLEIGVKEMGVGYAY
jgi:hypothetical protein